MTGNHEKYMHQCLSLAQKALAAGDPPVGSIIVFNKTIIGTGTESGRTTKDITNHAEILAVRDAISNGHSDKLTSSVLYTTHEPCVMCSYLIRHQKIPTIVYGISVPFTGGATSRFDILLAEDVPKWGNRPEIICGICYEECSRLNEEFANKLNRQ
ncbi:MAG: nucleoside deaminase [Chitinophagaceae bacterium]|nr:MAG: nucleoside deaminase [Chitinophagaceae bacterium]